MLDLPGHPTLDKGALTGTCRRLRVDAARIQAKVAALPESSWAGTGGRVDVHRATQAIFLPVVTNDKAGMYDQAMRGAH